MTYTLTDDEVLLLDGKVSAETQGKINFIKQSRSLHAHPLIGKALAESISTGKFVWHRKPISRCPLCDKHAGYHVFARSSRSAWGHRKGQPDYSNPKTMPGIEINPGRVTFKNSGDCCEECNQKDKVIETIKSMILTGEMPIQLVRDKDSIFKKDVQRKCHECKELIYESEMGELPAILSGKYAGKCHKCGAEEHLFGSKHEITNSFRMIRKAEVAQ